MPQSAQFQSLLQDKDIIDEIRERAAARKLPLMQSLRVSPDALERTLAVRPVGGPPGLEARPGAAPPLPIDDFVTEAIVLEQGRPSLIIQNGTFAPPDMEIWRETLSRTRSNVEAAIARVGRIELHNHLTFDWVGTGWLVADNIIITNRHVAEEFAVADGGGGFTFATNVIGTPISAQIDLREEFEIGSSLEIQVRKILHVAGHNEPDIALLQIDANTPLPPPISLSSRDVEARQLIGVIGYPAFDSRNGLDAMRKYFGEVFDVKRFAPGKVSFPTPEAHYFVHDSTTLGGNSGSKVIDLETGQVVGLHFSGIFLQGNFAVKAKAIKQALADISTNVSVRLPTQPPEEAIADGRHEPEFFAGRLGYESDFLGSGGSINMPGLGPWSGDQVPVNGNGNGMQRLDYCHFSVVMSQSRKLPIVTAVNIDGRRARRAFRADDKWYVDLRIPEELQLGNEIYRGNDLDRGHMVRRLDPVWGAEEEAQLGNDDTFHYVNAAPQHKDLNQREWSDLEDYILDSAKAKDLKVSVFTGPIMRDDDKLYRDLVKIPREFWKIAVLVNKETGELSAAGYILSQGEMLRDITEMAFVFGEFRTYQVPIASIEAETRLDFGPLRDVDTLQARGPEEGFAPRAVVIRGPSDLVL